MKIWKNLDGAHSGGFAVALSMRQPMAAIRRPHQFPTGDFNAET
jgi:hypothetical protein